MEVVHMFRAIRGRGRRSAATPAGPPQGSGHYSANGDLWWDDPQRRWFCTSAGEDRLEIEVEEIGERSLLRSLATTLSGSYGSAYFWFVGKATSVEPRWSSYRMVGDSFPVMRAQPFDELGAGGPFADDARLALIKFRRCLVDQGWKAEVGRGQHWYSYLYVRPTIDWESRPDAKSGESLAHMPTLGLETTET
jgi:hypothetical protein